MAWCGSPAQASDLAYLQRLLASTPEGGWVKANTTPYSSAWATGAAALPDISSHRNPSSVVQAWSSVAWDSNRSQLILWGGGHASYRGNEVYTWKGSDGSWTRGSLASRIELYQPDPYAVTYLVADDKAPQSAHTYDGNVYLRQNDMMITVGGAAFNTGGDFQVRNSSGQLTKAGPWLWDPTKADANKVGGSNFSGYDPTSLGGNMWINRAASTTGTGPVSFVQNTTAYRQEGQQDVVYLTAPDGSPSSSGFPALFRYAVGDVRNGGTDTWEKVGGSWNAPTGQATAAIDTAHGLYVYTAALSGYAHDLGVWNLTKNNASDPNANLSTGVNLFYESGAAFEMTTSFAIGYDEANGRMLLWDGSADGTVWEARAAFNANGDVASNWTIKALAKPSASAAPSGSFLNGVQGKWQYVSELGAFIALNEFNPATGDAEVWLYKSSTTASITPVPEPGAWALMLAGLMTVAARTAKQKRGD